jgi:hypothetical protein
MRLNAPLPSSLLLLMVEGVATLLYRCCWWWRLWGLVRGLWNLLGGSNSRSSSLSIKQHPGMLQTCTSRHCVCRRPLCMHKRVPV